MDTHELLEMLIPLYDKYYTTEDLKAVNAFLRESNWTEIIIDFASDYAGEHEESAKHGVRRLVSKQSRKPRKN